MADASLSAGKPQISWKAKQAYAMAVVCLLVGLLAGYLLRGSSSSTTASSSAATQPGSQPGAMQPGTIPAVMKPGTMPPNGTHPMPTMEQMKQMADKMTAPLIAKLKANPNDTKVLIQIAGLYNKAHQFKDAADYYGKALRLDPKNVDTRNEMASCLYYSGDADGAIAQLQQSLKTDPRNVNALFNLGMVRWKGKNDSRGAIAAWQQLLKANPMLDRKPIVEQMIAEAAKSQSSAAN
jgi:cytochrome c-type biogenesis protein CcmH/NrfG